jgi:hypothetical protein
VIFTSPSLRHIHLACADITLPCVKRLLDFKERTNLRSLVFEECNIDANALNVILSKPKALKRLTLGERLYHFHRTATPSLSKLSNTLAGALELQAQSLEHLKHTARVLDRQHIVSQMIVLPTGGLRLPTPSIFPLFPKLKELDVLYESFMSCITFNPHPALEKLRVHQIFSFMLDRNWLLRNLLQEFNIFDLPNLKHLELVMIECRTHREDNEEQWLDALLSKDNPKYPWYKEEARMCVWELSRRLKKRGVRVTVNWIRSAGFIPPFMYGEILPMEFNIYDSDRMDTFGSVEKNRSFRDADCRNRARKSGIFDASFEDIRVGPSSDSTDEEPEDETSQTE